MNEEHEVETAEAAARLQRLADECKILLPEEISDLRMVLHALQVYRFERDGANTSVERMKGFREQARRDHEMQMRRIWALADRKRKTVPMDALYAALTDPLAKTDTTTTDQQQHAAS